MKIKKKKITIPIIIVALLAGLLIYLFLGPKAIDNKEADKSSVSTEFKTVNTPDEITVGTQAQRGFNNDNVLHSSSDGDIHYSSYIPESYDGSEPYALFITLPGWEGLYFQASARIW